MKKEPIRSKIEGPGIMMTNVLTKNYYWFTLMVTSVRLFNRPNQIKVLSGKIGLIKRNQMFDLNSRISAENLIASGYKVGNSDSVPVSFLPKLVPIHLGMKTIKFSKKPSSLLS